MAAPLDRRLLRDSGAARSHLRLVAVLGVLSAAVIVAQAVLLADIIDRAALQGASVGALRTQLLALGAVLLARAAIDGGFELSARLGAHRVMSDLRGRLTRRLLCAGGTVRLRDERTGELAAGAVQGVDALQSYFAGYLPQLVLAAVVPLAVLGFSLTVDPLAAGILAVTVPILIVFMILIGKGTPRPDEQALAGAVPAQRPLPRRRAGAADAARAPPRARPGAGRWPRSGERYRAETMATLRLAFLSALVLELCAMIGTAMAAAAIGVQLAGGDADAGRGPGRAAARARAVRAAAQRRPAVPRRRRRHSGGASASTPCSTRSPRSRSRRRAATSVARAALPDPAREPIRLEGVSYEYPTRGGDALRPSRPRAGAGARSLRSSAPAAPARARVARLLMRLADPTDGPSRCGGRDLRGLDPERWRSADRLGAPAPAAVRRDGRREHRARRAPAASEESVRAAARAAGALEFIERLPQGHRNACSARAPSACRPGSASASRLPARCCATPGC